jgi:glycosyltransferase involved in cell wall biosynthesis
MSATSRTIRVGAEGVPRPAVSVVVPARNAERTIAACLRALARQALAPADLEVIVVDDGSVDDTAAIAGRFPGVRVLRQGRFGAEAARRAGAAAAHGTMVAFAEPDHPPPLGWLDALLYGEPPGRLRAWARRARVYGAAAGRLAARPVSRVATRRSSQRSGKGSPER